MNDTEVVNEIKRLAEAQKLPTPTPREEQIHALLNDSVEKLADGWISQLNALRKNIEDLETELLACVVQTKSGITRLHDLGQQIAAEAQRGREVCIQLANGINEIARQS